MRFARVAVSTERARVRVVCYKYFENVASHFASDDENAQQSDDEVLLAALGHTADEKLNGLALRIVLTDYLGIPHDNQPGLLTEPEALSARKNRSQRRTPRPRRRSPGVKAIPKKTATVKKAQKTLPISLVKSAFWEKSIW